MFLTKIVHKIWNCPGKFLPVLHTFLDTGGGGHGGGGYGEDGEEVEAMVVEVEVKVVEVEVEVPFDGLSTCDSLQCSPTALKR